MALGSKERREGGWPMFSLNEREQDKKKKKKKKGCERNPEEKRAMQAFKKVR